MEVEHIEPIQWMCEGFHSLLVPLNRNGYCAGKLAVRVWCGAPRRATEPSLCWYYSTSFVLSRCSLTLHVSDLLSVISRYPDSVIDFEWFDQSPCWSNQMSTHSCSSDIPGIWNMFCSLKFQFIRLTALGNFRMIVEFLPRRNSNCFTCHRKISAFR